MAAVNNTGGSSINIGTPLPPMSRFLTVAIGGKHWKGVHSLENIVVLGDSYSRYPSITVTWVDNLVRRFAERGLDAPNIHNFAVPGGTAERSFREEVRSLFYTFEQEYNSDDESDSEPKVSQTAPLLDADKTTYFIYFGINDCAMSTEERLKKTTTTMFQIIQQLYAQAGARNFVLIDIPDMSRSPLINNITDEIRGTVEDWNQRLEQRAFEFGNTTKDATVLLFSSSKFLNGILDDPGKHGFTKVDVKRQGGGIWLDHIHLTNPVHEILSTQIMAAIVP